MIVAHGAVKVFPDSEEAWPRIVAAVQRWLEGERRRGVRIGDLVFDPVRDELVGEMVRVKLTGKERQVLWVLSTAAGCRSLSAQQLADTVGSTARAVRVHVARLRAKIEQDLGQPRCIVHDSRGYCLVVSTAAFPVRR